jgi:hypothetical protein
MPKEHAQCTRHTVQDSQAAQRMPSNDGVGVEAPSFGSLLASSRTRGSALLAGCIHHNPSVILEEPDDISVTSAAADSAALRAAASPPDSRSRWCVHAPPSSDSGSSSSTVSLPQPPPRGRFVSAARPGTRERSGVVMSSSVCARARAAAEPASSLVATHNLAEERCGGMGAASRETHVNAHDLSSELPLSEAMIAKPATPLTTALGEVAWVRSLPSDARAGHSHPPESSAPSCGSSSAIQGAAAEQCEAPEEAPAQLACRGCGGPECTGVECESRRSSGRYLSPALAAQPADGGFECDCGVHKCSARKVPEQAAPTRAEFGAAAAGAQPRNAASAQLALGKVQGCEETVAPESWAVPGLDECYPQAGEAQSPHSSCAHGAASQTLINMEGALARACSSGLGDSVGLTAGLTSGLGQKGSLLGPGAARSKAGCVRDLCLQCCRSSTVHICHLSCACHVLALSKQQQYQKSAMCACRLFASGHDGRAQHAL